MARWSGLGKRCAAAVLLVLVASPEGWAWGGEGHRMINRMAAANLPAEVPSFLRSGSAVEEMEFLGPEPDRWKSPAEPELAAASSPEHYMDLEWAELADVSGALPRRRFDYIRALAAAQKVHPELTLTPEKVGLLPYEADEVWERLKEALREYRAVAAAHGDTRPVERTALFYAGWLGHYVGDGSMPLHTTIQFNGWTGPNPNGYTTEHRIHADWESTYVAAHVTRREVEPMVAAAPPRVVGDVWTEFLRYLRQSNALVERTYQIEKRGGFAGEGTAEGKQFTEERLAAGAEELRDLILTAWVRSADPVPERRGNG